jgi:hypothetical protein
MLSAGKFIKEEPPEIGKLFIPEHKWEKFTPEERFVQDLLLDSGKSKTFIAKLFDVFARA